MRNLQRLINTYADEKMKAHCCSTRKIYVRILFNFDHFQNSRIGSQQGWQHLQEESLVLGWLRNQDKLVNTKNPGLRLRLLRDFLEYLKGRDLIDCNVIDQLYKRYPLRGWRGLAEAGKGANPTAALEKLLPKNRLKGPWGKQMCDFILFKRRLGAKYEFEERTLADLDEYLVNADIPLGENLPPALINQWLLNQSGNNKQTLNTKRRVAERFFEHLRSLGLVQKNPAGGSSSAPRQTLRPYIFSKEQIQQILHDAGCMPDIPFFAHRGITYQMVFATLYCLGLRISELCRLCLSDIDFENGFVLIRPSKFYKSRLLPLGPKYLHKMKHFVKISHVAFHEDREEAPLFLSYYGKRMQRGSIGRVFRNLANQMGLKPKSGQRGPSLHSFRHTFAVHRLLRWYRQGEDVQAKLPLLSVFLGHVDIGSTQIYLDMIPELLEQVHLRFESYCGNHFFNQGGRYHEKR